jgi:hypothetical protein
VNIERIRSGTIKVTRDNLVTYTLPNTSIIKVIGNEITIISSSKDEKIVLDYALITNKQGATDVISYVEFLIDNDFIVSASSVASETALTSILTKLSSVYTTIFEEQVVALRTSQMNFKPTWGTTTYRYKKVTTGTGATVAEVNGEFRFQSGTAINTVANLETNQRGQYQAGTMGQFGAGFRIPTMPIGTQYAKWGYSDFVESGFYYGVDVIGIFVAYLTGGVETKIYQADWNEDKLNGLGESGLELISSDGSIVQIDFTWYGYGSIKYSFLIFNTITLRTQKVVVHTVKIFGSASIIDPNQPLKFEVGNGASSTTDFSLYIGGHQFSIIDGFSTPQKRVVSELLTNYTTATNILWQPLITFRKKATFNGRPNSVNVQLEHFEVSADGEIETRITNNGITSNLTFAAPTGVTATETGVETKVTTSGTALTTSSDGQPIDYGFVNSSNKAAANFESNVTLVLGSDVEVILWIRRLSAGGAIVVKHAHLTWKEEW